MLPFVLAAFALAASAHANIVPVENVVPITIQVITVPTPVIPSCNVQAKNSKPARVRIENFCNTPTAKTQGNDLLRKFENKWTWSFAPQLGTCHRHIINFNGTNQVYHDVNGTQEWVYIEQNGVVFRDQPEQWRCRSVSTSFYPLDSSPDNNVILQIECVSGGYEFYIYIQDFARVNQANRDELTEKFGFDLSQLDATCANLRDGSANFPPQ